MAGENDNNLEIEKNRQNECNDITVPKIEANNIGNSQSEKDHPIPEEVMSALEEMPPEIRRSFQAFIGKVSQESRPGYISLVDKFTPEHIDKYLDYVQRDDDHEYELRKSNRWFYLVYSIIVLGVFIAGVIYLLPNDKDLLIQLIVIIVAIAGGLGGGYGLSKRQ